MDSITSLLEKISFIIIQYIQYAIIAFIILFLLVVLFFILFIVEKSKNKKEREDIEEQLAEQSEYLESLRREKDGEIVKLKIEKDEISAKCDKRIEEVEVKRQEIEQKLKELQEQEEKINRETTYSTKDKAEDLKTIDEYQRIIIDLLSDIQEIEKAYVKLGGSLNNIYSDYDEYF